MGQKINPVGLRLGIIRTWYSRWFADRGTYRECLHEDLKLRKYIKGRMYQAGISTIDIERTTQRVIINIHSAKPGMIIGKRGVEIEQLRNDLQKKVGRQVFVNIHEVRVPEVDAQLVAENIAAQLIKRVSYRRVVKKAALLSMRGGAKGFKSVLSGRLAGAEIARYQRDVLGKVPLHTLRAEIDYGHATSFTAHGTIGVKVWIYKGDALFPMRGTQGAQVGGRSRQQAPVGPTPVLPAPPAPVAPVPVVVQAPAPSGAGPAPALLAPVASIASAGAPAPEAGAARHAETTPVAPVVNPEGS
jgi:small subunit ribosomal protein S3